uniref:SUEL-type lectin domain-containing protein n=1 Tax=Timema douglasi TaxID=61478 RepID=A0A7R8VDS9_TIMDO|nr:unnamed protein product [Timema douglasi]
MEVFSILILCCGFIVMEVLNFSSTLARSLEQPRYDTAYACEGKTLKIECNEGEIIHLIRANYGRFSITICNDHGNTEWSVNCMSPKSLRVLHTKCSQQQNCSILATTSMFGDPCPGTLKYLEAHYQCMPAAPPSEVEEVLVPHSTSSLPPSALPPSWKTTHWLTTASSTSVLDYTPSPSITWLQENELVLCSPTSARNLYWNWTQAGEVNVQPCPGGATGLARWRCVVLKPLTLSSPPTVSWLPDTPDLSECRSLWLTNLESRVEEGDSIISISNDLSQVTSSKTLYGGDMMTTTKIIKKMAQKMAQDIQTFPDPRQREAIVTELLHGVVVTGSNLLDSSQHPSWLDLSHKEQMRVATSLLMGLEENAFLLADTYLVCVWSKLATWEPNNFLPLQLMNIGKIVKTGYKFLVVLYLKIVRED